jgi:ATP/maltotriose-dependent transcriptional regulator MalT
MTDHAQPLVGRDHELEVLERLLGEAEEGTPRFAQVSGEAGIGKSYLLAEFGRRADAEGWLVLSGRSAELERELPFGLVIDAFDAYLASLDPQTFERVAPDQLDELAGLFPSLRPLTGAPEHPSTPTERFRAHRAVVEMIERLAARQPVLLLLDDLHWADGASIEQAAYVLRRPPEAAVMIVGSFRAGQASPDLVKAVTAASRERAIEFLDLGPLNPDDAAKLLDAGVDRDRLYEQSGGNPYYLLQLARATDHNGHGGELDGVPQAVASAIGAELEGLSATARRLADAAAVAGDPFELDLAIETAGIEETDALAAIDELTKQDLIRPAPVPRTFQFRHPLVRSAVYDASAPGARLAAHQRAAHALAAHGAPAGERAHHVLHAGRRGDSGAVAILSEAGQDAIARAPSSAARWFEAALRLLPEDAPDDERLGLLMPLAGALAAVGRLEDARAALVAATELAGDGPPVPRVQMIAGCAAVEELLGRHREAHERLEAALANLDERNSPDGASLMINLAIDGFYQGDYEQMLLWATQALEAARQAGEPRLVAAAAAPAAFAASLTGDIAAAEERRAETAGLVDGSSDEDVAERLDALAWLAAAEFYLNRYEEGRAHAERGLAVARATGQGELVPAMVQSLGNFLVRGGRVQEACELLDEAVDGARLTDNALGLSWSLLNRSLAGLFAGDMELALATSREAVALTEEMGEGAVAAWAGAILGGVLMEAGDYEDALKILVARGGGPSGELIPGAWRAMWLSWVCRCSLELGREQEAAEAARLARRRAEEFPLPEALGAADAAEAEVALATGDVEIAAEKALSAASHADDFGARVDAARWRMLAGRALAVAGEKDRAIVELEAAAEALDECGSARWRGMAERELGKLGRRTHRRTAAGEGDGVDSLTGRELEVATLVVDRRTNPEIAAELFLSVKTVETHMRNIFRKLDVSSRVEVARAVEAHDSEP